jgi:hypothetical protein
MSVIGKIFESRQAVIKLDLELVRSALLPSHGMAEMSLEDTKLAIVALRGIVGHQNYLIGILYEHLERNETKTFWQKLFNK